MELGIYIFVGFCVFVIGTLFGSFFSLAIYRLPRKEDILVTRSYCPNCKHRLEFFDLIPVLSFLFRRAKCKYCSDKISPRYFLLEISNGILFVIFYLIFGYTIKLAIIILIYAVLFVIIGAYVMKTKMSKEEIEEVNKKVNNKKLSKKAGVFISELIIALVLFIATFLTVIVLNRNTRTKIDDVVAKANANDLLIKNIEICLASRYDKLESYTLSQTIDNINYDVKTEVLSIYENDTTKNDIVKEVEVKVSYNLNGKYYETNMKTLKGKV